MSSVQKRRPKMAGCPGKRTKRTGSCLSSLYRCKKCGNVGCDQGQNRPQHQPGGTHIPGVGCRQASQEIEHRPASQGKRRRTAPQTDKITPLIIGVPDPGTALNSWVIDNSGYVGTFSWDSTNGGEIDLTLTKVPEPGTWGAAALAFGVVGYSQRRRFLRLLKRA